MIINCLKITRENGGGRNVLGRGVGRTGLGVTYYKQKRLNKKIFKKHTRTRTRKKKEKRESLPKAA